MFEHQLLVAFVDDDADLRQANVQALQLAGLEVLSFDSAAAALPQLRADFPGVVVTDIRMPNLDGHELFRRLREVDAELPVILITGHGDVAEAVQALKDGAYDFVAKPYPADRLLASVQRALEARRLVLDNRRLRALAERADDDETLLGDSPAMERLRATLRQLADTDVDVLIEGETGVGKEVVARALHRGRRRNRAFQAIDCAALPEALVESELFGHEAGAFPGALRRRAGRIEAADRGTLFLDNIESLPPPAQGKLLRVLEEREFTPVGANESRGVDVRVVAAAKVSLQEAVDAGAFRADLYYRLNVVRLRLPPLRERRGDIPLLFSRFLEEAARKWRREPPSLTDAVRRRLIDHDWPGNVRELRHYANEVALGLVGAPQTAESAPASLPERVDAYEAQLVREALTASQGDVRGALETLQIPRKTFYDKLRRHRIDINDYRRRN